jgi:glycosyltransferase involved in cell wall biosynthesis
METGKRMGHVCFLTGEYPPMQGGVADHTAYLAQHLVELGGEVDVITSRKAAATSQSPTPNLRVHPVITGWGPACWRQVGRFLDEHRPDVLHIQYQAAAYDLKGWVNWLPWWLRRRAGRPRLVVTFHDLRVPYLFPKAGPLRWRSILALAHNSDAVIVTNEEDEKTLSQSQISTPLFRVPLGGNVEPQPPPNYNRDSWRARWGLDSGVLLLAYFGFLNESKGGEELIHALDQLVRGGHDAHLLMIGGQVGDVDPTNRAYAARVRSLIQQRGLAERVHWTGHTSLQEVSANLLAADVVVMPYRDGVSFRRTTFIAALCHGRPVVTTYPSAPLAELKDGQNVLLVPPRDVESLAGAITRLAADADLRVRLSENAEALGRQFDWTQIARRTADVYQRILGMEMS